MNRKYSGRCKPVGCKPVGKKGNTFKSGPTDGVPEEDRPAGPSARFWSSTRVHSAGGRLLPSTLFQLRLPKECVRSTDYPVVGDGLLTDFVTS